MLQFFKSYLRWKGTLSEVHIAKPTVCRQKQAPAEKSSLSICAPKASMNPLNWYGQLFFAVPSWSTSLHQLEISMFQNTAITLIWIFQ